MKAPGHWIRGLLMASLSVAACSGRQSPAPDAARLSVVELRAEYQSNPLGIDVPRPRLSWQLRSDRRGTLQSAYQIRVATSERALLSEDLIWDSGAISSAESSQLSYGGPALVARQRYYWQMRVWSEHGAASDWSAPAWWEMGLLSPSQWTGKWIATGFSSKTVPMLRRAFTVHANVLRARVYVTSHGLYQLFLNGQRVGDAELTPGFTSYRKRLAYQTYDVSNLIRQGKNAVGAFLGEGWYSGALMTADHWRDKSNRFGDQNALLMQLEITYDDGTSDRVVTDEEWTASRSPILSSGIYAGETYDARQEQPGWSDSGFDDAKWGSVNTTAGETDAIVAQSAPMVRKVAEIVPVNIVRRGGETIVDMGQNMVGWVRLLVQGPAGATVTLRHGEVLDAKGRLYTKNLRTAAQLVRYTLKGQGVEIYEPHFTFQGFRYVAVDGYPGELTAHDITGIVVHTDLERTGDFETSNPLLNQLQHNIVWAQRGNFVDIPTDCPQRDERLGFTGDAQVIAPTAAFNFGVAGFFEKWLKDLSADQLPTGSVPWVVPDVLGALKETPKSKWNDEPAAGVAGWGDAATIIPWTLYVKYGDRRVLQEQYESMARWVEYERQRAGKELIWRGDFQFGDWAAVGGEATSNDLIATAYFAHSADLISRTAHVLGKTEDAARYAALFADIRTAFDRAYVTTEAKVDAGTQAAYVLALQFGLLSEAQRVMAARHLAEDVRIKGRLTTGFLATPWLLFALSEYGYADDAYRLLLRQEYPSWLYPVKRGATTIWEHWDGIKPNGSFADPAANSFNHYAYGAVGDWMYSIAAGIDADPAAPGYKHIIIEPQPGGGLSWVRASLLTRYGRVLSSWQIDDATFKLEVEIPPNTTATLKLRSARRADIFEGGRRITLGDGIISVRQVGTDVLVDVGSGQYKFGYSMVRSGDAFEP